MGKSEQEQTHKPDRLKYFLVFLGSLIGGALGVFLISYVFSGKMNDLFFAADAVLFASNHQNMSVGEEALLKSMLANGALFTPGELISEVSSFYERVITILTTLLGVLGVVAYMYVKSISEDNAFKVVRQAVDARFNGHEHRDEVTTKVREYVDQSLDSAVKDKMAGLGALQDDLEEYVIRIRDLEKSQSEGVTLRDLDSRIKEIERFLASKDDEEDDEGDASISL